MANAFAAAASQARAANEERYTQGMALWDKIIQRYEPGGTFGAGAMASYERGKTQATGAGMQQLVSSGLANTTVAATMGKKYEEEVGTPFRTQLEDMRMGRLSEAQAGKAGFIERREDVGPDAGLASQMGQMAGYSQQAQYGGYGSGGASGSYGDTWTSRPGSSRGNVQAPSTPGVRGGGGLSPSQRYQPGQGPSISQVSFQPTGAGGEPKPAAAGGAGFVQAMHEKYPELVGQRGFEGMVSVAAGGNTAGFSNWEADYNKTKKTGGGAASSRSWTRLSGAGGVGGGRF